MTAFDYTKFYNEFFLNKGVVFITAINGKFQGQWQQERERYLYKGQTLKNETLRNPRIDELTIEFDFKKLPDGTNPQQNTQAFIDAQTEANNNIKKIHDYCKKHELQYVHCSHKGKSDYIKIFGLELNDRLRNDIELLKGYKRYYVDEILIQTGCTYNKVTFDSSNIGSTGTLIPLEGRPHWKKEWNGNIHEILNYNLDEKTIQINNELITLLTDMKSKVNKDIVTKANFNFVKIDKERLSKFVKTHFVEGKINNMWMAVVETLKYKNVNLETVKKVGDLIFDKILEHQNWKKPLYEATNRYNSCKFITSKYFLNRAYEGIPDEQIKDIQKELYRCFFEIKDLTDDKNFKNDIILELTYDILKNFKMYTIKDNKELKEMWLYTEGIYVKHAQCEIEKFIHDYLSIEQYAKAIVKTIIDKIMPLTYIDSTEFFKENNKDFICVNNGIYNIKTKKLLPHTADKIFFNKLPIDYIEGVDCPKFKEFLKDVTNNNQKEIDTVQEMFGYCLYRDYHIQKAFIFLGPGANGKGTLLSMLGAMLGNNNTVNIGLQPLEKNGFMASVLHGKLANICTELSDKKLTDNNTFKKLVSNTDKITADRKNQTTIEFVNYAKMIFSCNDLPMNEKEQDYAFFRRIVKFKFNNRYLSKKEYDNYDEDYRKKYHIKIADLNIAERIVNNKNEMSGIFNWALDGLYRLFENKDFTLSEGIENVQADWNNESNSFLSFFNNCCTVMPGSNVAKTTTKQIYIKFCDFYGLKNKHDKVIKQTLSDKGIEDVYLNRNNNRIYAWADLYINLDKIKMFYDITSCVNILNEPDNTNCEIPQSDTKFTLPNTQKGLGDDF
jgi:P4 family phage/plasmid primase-like protien